MKRLLLLGAALAALASPAVAGQPECCSPPSPPSWAFRRSYYSHDPVTDVRIGTPSVPGGPYYTRPQGDFARGGWRNVQNFINIRGRSYQQLNAWESWYQSGSQY
jgi:hypothetical protein